MLTMAFQKVNCAENDYLMKVCRWVGTVRSVLRTKARDMASEQKETGPRLLTAYTCTPRLCAYRLSTGPSKDLSSWSPSNRSIPNSNNPHNS